MSFIDYIFDNFAVCERYGERLRMSRSKKEVASVLDANVCEWLAVANDTPGMFGWVSDNFSSFVNGSFVNECGGYDASVWCCGGGVSDIALSTDVTCLLGDGDTDVSVSVWDDTVCMLFASGCRVHVSIGDRSRLYVYASDSCVVDGCEGVVVRKTKSI